MDGFFTSATDKTTLIVLHQNWVSLKHVGARHCLTGAGARLCSPPQPRLPNQAQLVSYPKVPWSLGGTSIQVRKKSAQWLTVLLGIRTVRSCPGFCSVERDPAIHLPLLTAPCETRVLGHAVGERL